MTTKYQVIEAGTVAAEYSTEAQAVAHCERIADAYDDHAKPSVVAVTVSGTYRSTQAVYPVLGELRTK